MTESTGVAREARSLSGRDVGREVLHQGKWWCINSVSWPLGDLFVDLSIYRPGEKQGEVWGTNMVLSPEQRIWVRGRDE